MKKLKLYSLLVVGLLVIILLLNMDKIKKYAIPVLLLIAGFLAGWFLKPKVTVHKSICETETVYKDTCLTNKLIANISTTTETKQEVAIKQGKPKKEISDLSIKEVAVEVKDEIDSTYTTVFEKNYNFGLVKLNVRIPVTAKSPAKGKIELDYQVDTTILKEMTVVTNTAVVEKGTDDSFTKKTEVIPVEVKPTYLKLVGGISYTDKVFYPVGAGINFKGLEMAITKNVKAPGGNVTLSIPLIKLKD